MLFVTLARMGLLLLSGFGFLAGTQLSVNHLQHGEVCPIIGPIPACVIVFFGYLMIFLAAIIVHKSWSKTLFYFGWTPVFLLALFGVIIELTKGHICPPGPAGIPQCFLSLAMTAICWLLFRKTTQRPREIKTITD